jgi:hypothetical protein
LRSKYFFENNYILHFIIRNINRNTSTLKVQSAEARVDVHIKSNSLKHIKPKNTFCTVSKGGRNTWSTRKGYFNNSKMLRKINIKDWLNSNIWTISVYAENVLTESYKAHHPSTTDVRNRRELGRLICSQLSTSFITAKFSTLQLPWYSYHDQDVKPRNIRETPIENYYQRENRTAGRVTF